MIRVTQGMLAVRLLLLGALAASLSAQIGYPGGGYPGGGYPGGGRGGPGGPMGGPVGGGRGRGKTTDSTPSNSKGRKDVPLRSRPRGCCAWWPGTSCPRSRRSPHHHLSGRRQDDGSKDGKPVELTSFATADHLRDSTMDDMGYSQQRVILPQETRANAQRRLAPGICRRLQQCGGRRNKRSGTVMTTVRCAARMMVRHCSRLLPRSRQPRHPPAKPKTTGPPPPLDPTGCRRSRPAGAATANRRARVGESTERVAVSCTQRRRSPLRWLPTTFRCRKIRSSSRPRKPPRHSGRAAVFSAAVHAL